MKNEKKQALENEIATLERRLFEARAAYVSTISESFDKLPKSADCFGSGVILQITRLGGAEMIPPVLIRDGLSADSVKALRFDLGRSYELATIANGAILDFMPKHGGAK